MVYNTFLGDEMMKIILMFFILIFGMLAFCDFWGRHNLDLSYENYKKEFYSSTVELNGTTYHFYYPIRSISFKQNDIDFSGNVNYEGLFSVGTGELNSETYYYIYVETENNVFELKKFNTNTTKLYLTDEISPCIIAKEKSKEDVIRKNDDEIILVVPKNAITKNVKLDL